MRKKEAVALGRMLSELPAHAIDPVLNLGSSTGQFRRIEQPHIDRHIFRPLGERGVRVVHADLKAGEGVDVVGDIYDPAFRAEIGRIRPRLAICSNLLEHLEDREGFVRLCDELVPPDGYLLVTVPFDYPYHLDPIDTYFRPSPAEIAVLLPGYTAVWSDVVEDGSFRSDWRAMPLRDKLVHLASWWKAPCLYLFDRPRFLGRYHRWRWWRRSYKVSCVLMRKPA
jgi:hypothetical protein